VAALDAMYLQNDKPQLLEIFTPTQVNEKILLNYFKQL